MANNDRTLGLVVNQAFKNPARLATTVDLPNLNGVLNIDGLDTNTGDRILVKDQTDLTQNGIYIADSGAWSRAMDFDGSYDAVEGTIIKVRAGDTQQGFWEVTTPDPVVAGQSTITFGLASGALAVISGFMQSLLDDPDQDTARITLGLNAGGTGDIWIEKAGDTATGDITFNGDVLVRDDNFIVRALSGATRTIRNVVGGVANNTERLRFHVDEDAVVAAGWDVGNVNANVSASANTLTLGVRSKKDLPFDSDNVGIFKYRSATLASGRYDTITETGTILAQLSPGSTIGTQSGVPARLYFGIANDNTTHRLWWYNPWDAVNNKLLPLNEAQLYSSVAEGGAGAADSAHVLYSTVAFTNRAIRVLGFIEITQAVAGTWVTAPTKIELAHVGGPQCGEIVQRARFSTGALIQGAVITPADDTVPQSTEGSSFLGVTLAPQSAINIVRLHSMAQLACATTASMVMALHTTANSSAIAAAKVGILAANEMRPYPMAHEQLAGSTNSQTFTLRVGATTTANVMLNGETAARILGGVSNSFIEAHEVFA